jgi:hypothetical protein
LCCEGEWESEDSRSGGTAGTDNAVEWLAGGFAKGVLAGEEGGEGGAGGDGIGVRIWSGGNGEGEGEKKEKSEGRQNGSVV